MNEQAKQDTYLVRLKGGRKAFLILPPDLTPDDVERLNRWCKLLGECAAEDRVTEAAVMPPEQKGPAQ